MGLCGRCAAVAWERTGYGIQTRFRVDQGPGPRAEALAGPPPAPSSTCNSLRPVPPQVCNGLGGGRGAVGNGAAANHPPAICRKFGGGGKGVRGPLRGVRGLLWGGGGAGGGGCWEGGVFPGNGFRNPRGGGGSPEAVMG